MTYSEWEQHKRTYCAFCVCNSESEPCPAIRWMDMDPNDLLCTKFIRGEHCTQFDPRQEYQG